jgi:aspartate ammonia-lyase
MIDFAMKTRTENDSLGSLSIPGYAYWGIHTARAAENFPISQSRISSHPKLIRALAMTKKAAARTNEALGLLDARKADAVAEAADAVIAGRFLDQFIVDVIQGGAGTSTNMNMNEVLANVALESLGRERGDYGFLSPLDDVNMSQSTNDVYPTSVRIAICMELIGLEEELIGLAEAFSEKQRKFAKILKIGRTQLQDAVPMSLGQEFGAFAATIRDEIGRFPGLFSDLCVVNLGGTAIGTSLNALPQYAHQAVERLAIYSDLPLTLSENLIFASQDAGALQNASSTLKRHAVRLSKICNDLRLLCSGPQAGFGEIHLPPRAAGSSIMPGKVNPVIPEVVNQVAFEVIGNDFAITMAAEAGQLQLNAFEPLIAHLLLTGISHLTSAIKTLRMNCVTDIAAAEQRLQQYVASSASLVTALSPTLGYARACELGKSVLASGKTVREVASENGYFSLDEVDSALDPTNLIGTQT